jgi:hypothetical protein
MNQPFTTTHDPLVFAAQAILEDTVPVPTSLISPAKAVGWTEEKLRRTWNNQMNRTGSASEATAAVKSLIDAWEKHLAKNEETLLDDKYVPPVVPKDAVSILTPIINKAISPSKVLSSSVNTKEGILIFKLKTEGKLKAVVNVLNSEGKKKVERFNHAVLDDGDEEHYDDYIIYVYFNK